LTGLAVTPAALHISMQLLAWYTGVAQRYARAYTC